MSVDRGSSSGVGMSMDVDYVEPRVVRKEPDLTVAKTEKGPFSAGATGTYLITVTNVGGSRPVRP